jgi:quinol monooxygenase YgiN
MPNETLRVVARVTAQPDKVDEVKAILLTLIIPTRAEAGCISYELLQNKNDATDFVFVEEWSSDSALDVHMITTHLQDAVSRVSPLVAQAPDIRRYGTIA